MYAYEFLKNRSAVNVTYSAKNACIRFSAPKRNKNCIKTREAFLEFFKSKLLAYIQKNKPEQVYVVFYIGKEKQDVIEFYKDPDVYVKETYKKSHIQRKCYPDEVENYLTLFDTKDFTAENIERRWYFDKKKKEERFLALINGQKNRPENKNASQDAQNAQNVQTNDQLTIEDLMAAAEETDDVASKRLDIKNKKKKEPVKTKKQLKREQECESKGVNAEDVAPWESVDEYVCRKNAADDRMVTAKLMLSRETLNEIIAKYDIKVIDRDDTDNIVSPVEAVEDFFASL